MSFGNVASAGRTTGRARLCITTAPTSAWLALHAAVIYTLRGEGDDTTRGPAAAAEHVLQDGCGQGAGSVKLLRVRQGPG